MEIHSAFQRDSEEDLQTWDRVFQQLENADSCWNSVKEIQELVSREES